MLFWEKFVAVLEKTAFHEVFAMHFIKILKLNIMKNFQILFLCICSAIWGIAAGAGQGGESVHAQDFSRPNVGGTLYEENANFRVNYKILETAESTIVSSGKTLFCDGNIYDFVDNSDEVIVFNSKANKIYVLDVKERKKWQASPEEVEEYVSKIYRWGMSHPKAEIRQYFQPDFKINYEEEKEEYSFVSENFSYFVTPKKPEKPEFLEKYRYFARWSCQTNMMLSPGSKTLYARSVVNETVFNAGFMIESLQLSIKNSKNPFAKPLVLLSEYQYLPRLVDNDLTTIRQVEDYLVLFRDGTLEDFQQKRLAKEKK